MKGLLLIISLFFYTLCVGQSTLTTPTAKGGWTNTSPGAYGNIVNRIAIGQMLNLPTGCGAGAGVWGYDLKQSAIYFDSCNAKAYMFNPKTGAWIELTTGGAATTTLQQAIDNGRILNKWNTIITSGNNLGFDVGSAGKGLYVEDSVTGSNTSWTYVKPSGIFGTSPNGTTIVQNGDYFKVAKTGGTYASVDGYGFTELVGSLAALSINNGGSQRLEANATNGLRVYYTSTSNGVSITASGNSGFVQSANLDDINGLRMRYGNTDLGGGIRRVNNNYGELQIYSDSALNNSSITFWTKGHKDMTLDSAGKVYYHRLPNATSANILYYNSSTGEATYGAAPSITTPDLAAVTAAGAVTSDDITTGNVTAYSDDETKSISLNANNPSINMNGVGTTLHLNANNISSVKDLEFPNVSGNLAEAVTDGTTTVHADDAGLIDISSLHLGINASNGTHVDGGTGDIMLGGSLTSDVNIDGAHNMTFGTFSNPIGSFGVDATTAAQVYGNMHISSNSFDYAVGNTTHYYNYNWAGSYIQADFGERSSGDFLDQTITSNNMSLVHNGSPSGGLSAILNLETTTAGFLAPRMTQTQRNAISSPETGLLIYQTDNTPGFRVYNGSAWTTLGSSTSGTVTSITATAPLTGGTITNSGSIGITQANTSTDGYLSSTDWNTFNNKQAALSGTGFVKISGTTISYDNSTYLTSESDPLSVPLTRTISTSSPLSGGGDLSANRTLSIADAADDGSTKGAASFTAADFNAISGNISIDYANGQAASGSAKGFLSSADWSTFNNKQAALSGTGYAKFSGTTPSYVASIPNADLANSTISGVSLGGTLADLSGDGSLAVSGVGVYNGSTSRTIGLVLSHANTWGAGAKQTFSSSATTAGLSFAGVSSDPSSLSNGDVWHNTTTNNLKYRSNGTTRTIANLDEAQTLTNKTIAAGSNTISGLTNSNLSGTAGITVANQSYAANSMAVNQTGSTAAPTAAAWYDSGELTYAGSFSNWVGTTAPSGALTATYRWTQVGKNVTFYLWAKYSVNGTSITNVDISWPSDLPLPAEPSTFSTTGDIEYVGHANMASLQSIDNRGKIAITKTGTGTYKFQANTAATNARTIICEINYMAQ